MRPKTSVFVFCPKDCPNDFPTYFSKDFSRIVDRSWAPPPAVKKCPGFLNLNFATLFLARAAAERAQTCVFLQILTC